MSAFASDALRRGGLAGLVASLVGAIVALWAAPAAAQGKIPNFAPNSKAGWLAAGG
jgi:hypothetical protein